MADIDSFFEQIDEELEAERVRKYMERNKDWIIGGFILFFACLFGYVGWQNYHEKQANDASEIYHEATQALESKQPEEAVKLSERLIQEYPRLDYSQLAQVLQARSLVSAGKKDQAITHLDRLAKESKDTVLQEFSLLEAAYLSSLDKAKARAYLQRIPKESSFSAHALELEGLLMGQEGNAAGALAKFQESLTKSAAGSALQTRLQNRVERMAGAKQP